MTCAEMCDKVLYSSLKLKRELLTNIFKQGIQFKMYNAYCAFLIKNFFIALFGKS